MAFLGIDVGGHSIKAGIVSKDGVMLDKEIILTEPEKGRDVVVDNIVKAATVLLERAKNIEAIGVGIPGILDKNGYISYTPNIPLTKYDLGKELKKKLGKKKIVFGNDAHNFALAQHTFGSGKGYDTVVALTLGTGVGSGLIINGKPFVNKGAPELGHTTIKFDANESKCCGNSGCIESFIGRKSFPEGPLEIYKKALVGDKDAIKRFADYGTYLGIAISNFVNMFNPDIVILGGELSNAYNFFKKTMETEILKRSLFKTRVVKSNIKYAGTIGAAILAF
jgi:glucokinase